MAVVRKSKANKARAAAQLPVGAFHDPSAPPAECELAAALGAVHPLSRIRDTEDVATGAPTGVGGVARIPRGVPS
jgi:hypothetical protein